MPLYPRVTTPMVLPGSLTVLAQAPPTAAVLELPFTMHDWVDAIRMYYQIGYNRPTTSGYLSRTIPDPYAQACAPLHIFYRYRPAEAHDIVTPTAASQVPMLLAAQGIGYVVVYKERPVTSQRMDPLPDWELADLQGVGERVGNVLVDDGTATTYQVRPVAARPGLFLQLGPGWHDLEDANGAPFRWTDSAQSDVCVFSPQPATAALTFTVTSFAVPRHLQVWVGDRQVYEAAVPADAAPQTVTTPPLAWPAGPQLVRLVAPEAPTSAAARTAGRDTRLLGLGVTAMHLGGGP